MMYMYNNFVFYLVFFMIMYTNKNEFIILNKFREYFVEITLSKPYMEKSKILMYIVDIRKAKYLTLFP